VRVKQGSLLGEFGEAGTANGQFNRALTSAVHDRTVFVSDGSPPYEEPGNMRIQKYHWTQRQYQAQFR
jgi:hypothetical protein